MSIALFPRVQYEPFAYTGLVDNTGKQSVLGVEVNIMDIFADKLNFRLV